MLLRVVPWRAPELGSGLILSMLSIANDYLPSASDCCVCLSLPSFRLQITMIAVPFVSACRPWHLSNVT